MNATRHIATNNHLLKSNIKKNVLVTKFANAERKQIITNYKLLLQIINFYWNVI